MDPFKVLNIRAACRLCLLVAPDLPSIFLEAEHNPNDSPALAARISACVGFEIVQKENLPSRICAKCLQEVDRWFVFRTQCQNTNNLLTKVFTEGYQIVSISLQNKVNEESPTEHANSNTVVSKTPSPLKQNHAESTPAQDESNHSKSTNIVDKSLHSLGLDSEIVEDLEVENFAERDYDHESGDDGEDQKVGDHEADSDDSGGISSLDEFEVPEEDENAQDDEAVSWRNKPVKCPLCFKSYPKFINIKAHLRLKHTVLKLFPCKICGHVSVVSTHRERHVAKRHQKYLRMKGTCKICGLQVKNSGSFSRHIQKHEEDRRCGVCQVLMDTVEALEEHQKIVHQAPVTEQLKPGIDPSYHCHHCENVSFWKKEDWKQHYLEIHKTEDVYPCKSCHRAFRSKGFLEIHTRIHTGEKPFMCELCATRFGSKHSLRAHMRKHTRNFQCPECLKTYTSPAGLRYHVMRLHGKGTPFICHECGKTFKSENGVYLHMRTHTGEKPYKCEHCDSTFSNHSGLYAHRVIHSDERPFKCDQCDKSFKMKGWLKTHQKTHTGIKNFVCEVCNHAFIAMYQLRSHLKTHSGERSHECDICSKKFARRDGLTEHMRTHTKETKYKCQHCKAEFMFLKSFKRHKCLAESTPPTSESDLLLMKDTEYLEDDF